MHRYLPLASSPRDRDSDVERGSAGKAESDDGLGFRSVHVRAPSSSRASRGPRSSTSRSSVSVRARALAQATARLGRVRTVLLALFCGTALWLLVAPLPSTGASGRYAGRVSQSASGMAGFSPFISRSEGAAVAGRPHGLVTDVSLGVGASRDAEAAAAFSLPGGYVRPSALARVAARTVFLFKTGYTVAFARIPAQVMRVPPIPPRPYRRFYSDVDAEIDGVWMKDILRDCSPRLQSLRPFETYHNLQNAIGEGLPVPAPSGRYWEVDAYKFLPMHQDAYLSFPGAQWHVAADGDSHLFTENVLRYLALHDARNRLFLGHPEERQVNRTTSQRYGNGTLHWAHGGSGYVLSQGLLDHLLKKDPTRFTNGELDDIVVEEGGGDVILGRVITELTKGQIMGPASVGWNLFNSEQVRAFRYESWSWWLPVMSMHHMTGLEIYGVRQFEERMLNKLHHLFGAQGGDYIRRCDIALEMQPALFKTALQAFRAYPRTTAKTLIMQHAKFATTNSIDFGPDWAEYLNVTYTPDLCTRLCEERDGCYGWQWLDGRGCALQMNAWNIPQTAPDEPVTSGVRLDRIARFLDKHDCYDYRKRIQDDSAVLAVTT